MARPVALPVWRGWPKRWQLPRYGTTPFHSPRLAENPRRPRPRALPRPPGKSPRQRTSRRNRSAVSPPLAGAQELVHILSWAYGVVPATELFVGDEVELTHFRVRDLGSGGVGIREEIGADGKAGFRFGGSDEVENLVDIGERFACPVLADLAEQTMFDGIPLRSARGIVADGNGEAERSTECILKRFPPGAASRAVASSAIRQDEQFAGGRVSLASLR